jgi:preprotein translocase subunit SecA
MGEGNEENKQWLIEQLSKFSGFNSEVWEKKEKEFGKEVWLQIVSAFSRPVIDYLWMDHLVDMDQVREGIGLRGYAQRDPMVEYKREGHERFGILVSKVYSMVGERLLAVSREAVGMKEEKKSYSGKLAYQHGELQTGVSDEGQEMAQQRLVDESGRELKIEKVESGKEKVGRNDPCPCGSGKKYKNCHGK